MNLGSINVKVGVDTRDLQRGLESAKASAQQFAQTMGQQSQTLAASTRAMQESAASTTSNAERTRQLAAASRELMGARARLAEILGGESKIAQDVAAKYSSLTNAQRAQLITVKEQTYALQQKAKAAEAAARTEQNSAGLGAGLLGGAGLLAAGAVAQGFASAIRSSIEFNKELANVAAVAGASSQRIAELKGSVQQLAMETGKDTTELTKGLYQVESAFGDSADSAKSLAINTKLAIGGVSTVESAIALTSATTKAYGDTSAAAQKSVADLALTTVKLGQTTLPELAAAMGKVTPLAAALKISQQELYAVMATGSGVTGTASEVATQYRGILQSLMAPTASMIALFQKAGVTSGEALIQQRGFSGAVQLIKETADASHTPLQKYIQSIEGQTLALSLAGPQAQKLIDTMKAMQTAAGETERALDKQQNGVNKLGAEWDKLRQSMKVAGQGIAETVSSPLAFLTEKLNQVAGALLRVRQEAIKTNKDVGEQDARLRSEVHWQSVSPYANLVDQARSGYLNSLSAGAGTRPAMPVGSGGPARPLPSIPQAAAPTKEQMAAHNKVLADLTSQAFATARQQAVQFHGELSRQVAALDLYHRAWEKLTGGEQKNALQLLANEKAEQRSRDAVKANEDAISKAEKTRQKAVEDRRRAEEKAAAERKRQHEEYRDFLREQEAATHVAQRQPGAGLAQFRLQHPDFSAREASTAYNAEQVRKHTEAITARTTALEAENQQLLDTMQSELKEAQLDADSARAKRKYGEVNRESLAIESQWSAHYLELAPNQQRIIDQLYQLALARKLTADQDKAFEDDAKRRIKAYEDEQRAVDKQIEANIDLEKVMAARRREQDQAKEDIFNQGLKDLGERLNQPADAFINQVNDIAEQTRGIFENAFHDAFENGPAQFFKSVVQGVERMFQDIAARYLASQLTNLIFGGPNAAGDRNVNGIAGVIGGFLGSMGGGGGGGGWMAAGGPVHAGGRYMVGERGPELFVPSTGGSIIPNAQMAGAGGVNVTQHITIQAQDANSIRQNREAIAADLHRSAQRAFRRSG